MSQAKTKGHTQTVRRQSSWWKRNQARLTPWLFMAPGLILFTIYVMLPISQSIQISLYEWDGLLPNGPQQHQC